MHSFRTALPSWHDCVAAMIMENWGCGIVGTVQFSNSALWKLILCKLHQAVWIAMLTPICRQFLHVGPE
jgi:hypothetical protein